MQNIGANYFVPFQFNKYDQESPETSNFKKHKVNVFIVTKYGRTIYVRYGDQIKCSSFLATLNTIFNKITLFHADNNQPSTLNKIQHKNMTVYLLKRKNINYICLSKVQYDQIIILSMLDFLNMQIISSLTDSVNGILQQKPNYNPSINFSPSTINLLSSAIKIGLYSPCIFLNSLPILYLPFPIRNQINNIIRQNNNQHLHVFLLMTLTHIIALNKKKQVQLKVEDILILFNLLQTQKSLKNSQNWLTICFPGLSPESALFCYTNFITQNLIVVMITDQSFEMFYEFSNICKQFKQRFRQIENYNRISQILNQKPIQLEVNFEKSKLLKHFLIRNNIMNQIVMSSYNYFGRNKQQFTQILNAYAELYRMELTTPNTKKEKMSIQNKYNFLVGVYNTGVYTLFFTAMQYINLEQVKVIFEGLKKWLKQEESNLFISRYV